MIDRMSDVIWRITATIARVAAVVAGRWRWRKASSLAHLADLQADRIARRLGVAPAQANMTTLLDLHAKRAADGQADPRWSMYAALVALGRAGMVVGDWTPGTAGTTDDGVKLESRACVTGFADDETKYWLDELLYYAGEKPGAAQYKLDSVMELYAPGCLEYDRCDGDDSGRFEGHADGRIDGRVTQYLGGSMTAREVYRAFPTRRSVQQELRKAWLVTICAPTWGESSMFDDLLPLLCTSGSPARA